MSSLLLLVLAPSHLWGAKVVEETRDSEGQPDGFVLDRAHPVDGVNIWVARSSVETAEVPRCCYAAESAEPAERLYAAYNLGESEERASLIWDDKHVPEWAELLERAAAGNPGAAGVVAKWRRTAVFASDFHADLKPGETLPGYADAIARGDIAEVSAK